MATKWQRVRVEIPNDLGPIERLAIAADVIRHIRKRTETGIGANGRPLPGHRSSKDNPSKGKYSKAYAESPEFQGSPKSTSKVNMTLSGDMLNSIQLLNTQKGSITVGYEKGSLENAKADGNIRGTYGKSAPIQPGKDFLGIEENELQKIINKYPRDTRREIERTRQKVLNFLKPIVDAQPRTKEAKEAGEEPDIKLNLEGQELARLRRKIRETVA